MCNKLADRTYSANAADGTASGWTLHRWASREQNTGGVWCQGCDQGQAITVCMTAWANLGLLYSCTHINKFTDLSRRMQRP